MEEYGSVDNIPPRTAGLEQKPVTGDPMNSPRYASEQREGGGVGATFSLSVPWPTITSRWPRGVEEKHDTRQRPMVSIWNHRESRMMGNYHVRFGGGGTKSTYPTNVRFNSSKSMKLNILKVYKKSCCVPLYPWFVTGFTDAEWASAYRFIKMTN